jgi:microcystin-dependent protein
MNRAILFLLLSVIVSIPVFSQETPLIVEPDGSVKILVNGEMIDLASFINPVGTIQAYGGITDPTGWMICDGRALSSSEYPRLFAIIGTSFGNGTTGAGSETGDFNIPDLRGQFLRGTDNGAGVDPDANSRTSSTGGNTGDNIGSAQAHAFQTHKHSLSNGTNVLRSGSSYGDSNGSPRYARTYTLSVGSPSTGNTSSETRPVNISVNFIIKY